MRRCFWKGALPVFFRRGVLGWFLEGCSRRVFGGVFLKGFWGGVLGWRRAFGGLRKVLFQGS